MSRSVTQIGKYHIIEQIGEGAMGVVYKATDPVLNRTVAIKVMSEGVAQDEALRARFLREAQAAGSLQHPNVVTIYDFGETDGHLFIAMEYIQGADLEHLLKHNAPLTLAAKLDIIIDVLNGLSYAHRRGIVHRDIKPANIRVDDEGHARIMDFGVAHLASSNMTKTGVIMGTPNYMPPEQITDDAVTAAGDLFSVGAVLFELLTNTKAFQADTMHGVLFKIVGDSPPDVQDLRPDVPLPLCAIVKKALEKNPADRFPSASEMANALSALRASLGAPRMSKTLAQRVSHRSSIEKALRQQRESHDAALSAARRWRTVGVGAAAILGIAAIGVFALGRGQSASAPPAAPAASLTAAVTPADTTPTRPTVVSESTPATAKQGASASEQQANPPTRGERETRPSTPLVATRPLRSSEAKIPVRESVVRVSQQDSVRLSASATPPPSSAAQGAPSQAPAPAPVVPAPVATESLVAAPTRTAAPPPEPENPRPAISSVVAAYARAIGTRDVSQVRLAYPGMTPRQQAAWESFFSSVRSINANLDIASLDVNGRTATARLTGVYEFIGRNGRTDRQPVAVEAVLQRDGDRWILQTVR